jgi:MFS family permease
MTCYAKHRRWILFAFAFLCTSLVAGMVYGWPALRQQLKDDGSQLSEQTLGAIFTVGAWSTLVGSFFGGLARDRFGTRGTVAVCMVLVTLGCLGIALCDPNDAMALGISLFAIGLGSGVQLCIQPVAGLFPKNAGTILSSLSGAFQISGLVFLALTSVGGSSSSSSNRKSSFLGFAACLLVLTVMALLLLPKGGSFVLVDLETVAVPQKQEVVESSSTGVEETEIPNEVFLEFLSGRRITEDVEEEAPADKVMDMGDGQGKHLLDSNHVEEGEARVEPPEEGPEVKEFGTNNNDDKSIPSIVSTTDELELRERPPPTAMEQLKSLEYILLCTWFSVCIVPLQYYVGSIGFQLEDKGDEDGFYTDLFSITYAGAIVFAPVGGLLADKVGLGATQGLATALTATSFFFLASDRISLNGQTLGLAFYGIGRMFVFGMYFANTGKRFGYTNYGALAGLGLLVSAIVSLFQYPLIGLAADGKAVAVNLTCGAALLSLAPYFGWLHRREKTHPVMENQ